MDYWGVVFAKILLNTKITPNQLTIFGIILGLLCILLISSSNFFIVVIGYLLLLFYWIIDYTDGVIARYRKTTSAVGKYLDDLGHFITPLMFLAIGVHIFHSQRLISTIIIGAIISYIYLAIYLNTRIILLTTKTRELQSYISLSSKKGFLKQIFRLHKNIIFCVHLVVYFLFAEIFTFISGIKLNYYLLAFYLLVFVVTLMSQIFIYSERLRKKDEK